MALSLRLPFSEDILWLQWIAGVAAMILMFVIGLSIGWSSPYLAQFTSGDGPFPATTNEISWMASIYSLGGLPGAIIGAVCIEYFGSKTVIFGNGCGILISWILVILANSVGWIYVSRFIFGASIESATVSIVLYLGDISSSKFRGALVTLAMNGLVIGIVAGNLMGVYLSLKLFAGITLIPNLCVVLVFFWLPHSPYYLINKDEITDAEKAILKYNPKADVHLEIESIKEFLAMSNAMTFRDRLREFNTPRSRKAGIIVIMLCMFTQSSGINILTGYMQNIMTRAMVTVIAPSSVPILSNGIGYIAGWIMMCLVEKSGRKIMWIVSSLGLCGAMIALGSHFYFIDDGVDPAKLQWLPIISVILVKFFYNAGIGTISSVLLSELFPSSIRTLAGCVGSISSAIFGFLSIYGYDYFSTRIAEAYVWWIHAIVMFLSVIFGLVLVPETKGKTLLEIQGVSMKK